LDKLIKTMAELTILTWIKCDFTWINYVLLCVL